jgi:hypothetical protein
MYLERDRIPIDCIAHYLWVVMAGEHGLAVEEESNGDVRCKEA